MHLLYPDLPLKEREERLALEAKKKEMRNYKRTMQPSEIDAERGKFSADAIEKKKLEKQLENIVKELKGKISSIAACMDERLEKIDTGKTEISGYLYGLPDFSNKRMMWRDKFGELVDSRDLLPDEMTGMLYAPPVNGALADLPFQTQQVLQEITNEGGWPEHGKPGWEKADDETLLKWYGTVDLDIIDTMIWDKSQQKYVAQKSTITHDEDGWAGATDADLNAIYGTVDISIIRTMVLDVSTGNYIVPMGSAKETKKEKKK